MTRQHPLAPRLDRVARRLRLERTCLVVGIGALLAAVAVLWVVSSGRSPWPILAAGTVLTLAGVVIVRNRRTDGEVLAHLVERRYPDLHQRLVTAIEQQPRLELGRLSYLQSRLVEDVARHDDVHDWRRIVSPRRLGFAIGFQALALLLLAGSTGWAMWRQSGGPAGTVTTSRGGTNGVAALGEEGTAVVVEPGDVEIERGSPLLVSARFADEQAVPADATLELRRDEATLERAMSRSLVDPLFAARLDHVENDLEYRVVFASGESRWFTARVYDLPRLERADATITLPAYTGVEPETKEDVRFLTVLEGSSIELRCLLNKPVATAVLTPEGEGEPVALTAVEGDPNTVRALLKPERNGVYQLHLVDPDGRSNANPPLFDFEVVANRRPAIAVKFPARDVEVSPLEELAVEATASDDFGVVRWGLAFSVAGGPLLVVTLGERGGRGETLGGTGVVRLEEHGAEPDQLVSYFVFAEDRGPDGEVRRTLGDMFFAEVRPFDEIFREGQSQAAAREQQQRQRQQGQQGGAGQQAEQLGGEQKQIVTATWNVLRRESGATPSEPFAEDVDAIREAQEAARTKLDELEQEITDAESKAFVEAARGQMTTAVESLERARQENAVEPLNDALVAEQAAWQSLLRLRAREHEVVRGQPQQQQQGGGGGQQSGANRSQQQLNQLELQQRENRYQTDNASRLAEAARNGATPGANDEALKTLNRLGELARRQSAVNEKLRELESELRTATTEEERGDLERELKRLREEQRELLRDVDELQSQVERDQSRQDQQTPENAQTQRQLDSTRERVREASEALERGQTSKALSEGTRAERELEELRNDFRRRTASEFEEEVRDLRNRARELAETQQEIGERLEEIDDPERRSLRTGNERREVEERLREQKPKLDGVLDDVRKVVERAETAEPLLSRQLYDTVRDLRRARPEERLESAADAVSRGRYDDARASAETARTGIEQLREGIERAAEGVVGDEEEALRRARDTLRELERDLEREVAENDPQRGEPRPGDEARPGQPGERQPGGQQPGDQQPGDQQPGEQQPGEQQPGGQQPGGQQPGGQQPGGQQPGGQQPGGQQPGGQQPSGQQPGGQEPGGQQPGGQQPGGQQPGGQQPGGQQPGGQQPGGDGQRQQGANAPRSQGGLRGGGDRQGGPERASDGRGGVGGPLIGEDYERWSDQLRVVEELIDDPELRSEVARIRDRARAMRAEFERHSKEPEWDIVRDSILKPLVELEKRVSEEVAKRRADGELVPINRDPVPEEFRDLVRRYYEELGASEGGTR